MMGEQLFRLFVGVGIGVWTARLLGPSKFGELSYAIAFATVFGIVGTLGLNRILVREMVAAAGQPQLIRHLMNTAFAMRLSAAVAVYAICVSGAWFSDDHQLLLIAIIAGSFFFSASDCIDQYFQARLQARIAVRARLLSFIVVVLFKVALLLAEASLPAFALVTLLEYVGAACTLQWIYRQQGHSFQGLFKPDWQLTRKLLAESWPEIIAGFSGVLFVRLNQIMLQHIAGPEAVGSFAVAARLSEAWYFVPSAIVASTFPNILASRAAGNALYMRRLQILMTVMCAISYVVAFLTMVLAEPVIQWLYGTPYKESAAILSLLVWSGLFVSLGLASGSWIMAEKRVHLNLYRNLAGLVTNIALNVLFIPRFGALGAAVATLISLVVAYMIFDLFVPSMRELSRAKMQALLILPTLFAIKSSVRDLTRR